MNYNIKVEKTEVYKDSAGEKIVCKGKLVLIKLDKTEGVNNLHLGDGKWLKPIIISETEVIKEYDICYYANNLGGGKLLCKAVNTKFGRVYQELGIDPIKNYGSKEGGITPLTSEVFKVLALPEHFSPETLRAIIYGELKDGDEVYLSCIEFLNSSELKHLKYEINQVNGFVEILPINSSDALTEKGLAIIKEELIDAGVRQYTCVNGFGYSELERNIVERILNLKK